MDSSKNWSHWAKWWLSKLVRHANNDIKIIFLFPGTLCFTYLVFVNNEFSKSFPEMNEHEKIPGELQVLYISDEIKARIFKKMLQVREY